MEDLHRPDMKYAKYDSTKLVSIGEGPELPDGTTELSEEQYLALVAEYSITSAPDPVTEAKSRIRTCYESAVNSYAEGYTGWEIASWLRQESEARSVMGDKPWIAAAAEAEGISEEELIAKIKAKSEVFTFVHANATGRLHKLLDAIDALSSNATREQLDSIQW